MPLTKFKQNPITKNYLAIVLLLIGSIANAQFPGSKSKDDFMAVDSATYSVGDLISFGQPMKGDSYASIISFKRKSFLDNVHDVSAALAGDEIETTEFVLSPKELNYKQNAAIKFFKILETEEGNIHYAIVPYNYEIYLAIPIDIALNLGEIKSKNPEYTPPVEKETNNNDTYIKSFSSSFEVKLLDVKGNTNDQTIEVEVLLKHKNVHQEVCFNFGKNDAKMYDFEGNEYLAKEVQVGAINRSSNYGGYACNTIPTNVPVKAKIVFKQVLPDKQKMSFMTLKVKFRASDGGSYEYGNLEITNMDVNWQ